MLMLMLHCLFLSLFTGSPLPDTPTEVRISGPGKVSKEENISLQFSYDLKFPTLCLNMPKWPSVFTFHALASSLREECCLHANSTGHVWLKCFTPSPPPYTLPVKSGSNGPRDLAHFQGSPFRVSASPPCLTSSLSLEVVGKWKEDMWRGQAYAALADENVGADFLSHRPHSLSWICSQPYRASQIVQGRDIRTHLRDYITCTDLRK